MKKWAIVEIGILLTKCECGCGRHHAKKEYRIMEVKNDNKRRY